MSGVGPLEGAEAARPQGRGRRGQALRGHVWVQLGWGGQAGPTDLEAQVLGGHRGSGSPALGGGWGSSARAYQPGGGAAWMTWVRHSQGPSAFPRSLTRSLPHHHTPSQHIHSFTMELPAWAPFSQPLSRFTDRLQGVFLATGPGGQEPHPWGGGSFCPHQPGPSWHCPSCQKCLCHRAMNSRLRQGARRGP